MTNTDTFQPLSATAAVRALTKLAPLPLVTNSGRFDTSAIASRASDLWNAKRDFLAQYEGEPLRFWRDQIWNGIVEKTWHEASAAQTQWLIDNAKPVQTEAERIKYAALWEQQNSLPIYADKEYRDLTWALQEIATAARNRAFDIALPQAYRTREVALADVRMPGNEMAVAAE